MSVNVTPVQCKLQEITQVMGGRAGFVDALPPDLQGVPSDGWEGGILRQRLTWYRLPISHGRYLYMWCKEGAVSSAELYLLRTAASAGMLDEVVIDPPWQDKIRAALLESPEPFAGPVRIEDSLENISVPWTWPVFLIGLRPSDTQSGMIMGEVGRTFDSLVEDSELRPYVILDPFFTVGVFPIAGSERAHGDQVGGETAQAIVDCLMSESFVDVRAVWSDPLRSFPEILRTLKRMRYLAQTSERLVSDRRVLSVKGLGIYELFCALRPQLRQAYADHVLPASAGLTLGSELEQTVMTFIQCDLNMSETARQLYLHRNSLLYRIDRIREITGYDIRRFDDAVTLWSALLLKRL